MTRLVCTFADTHACLYTCMYDITYTAHVCNRNASSQWDKSAVVRAYMCVCVSVCVEFSGSVQG